MDRTRFIRPETQKQRQITKTAFGDSVHVPKVLPSRALISTDGMRPRRRPSTDGIAPSVIRSAQQSPKPQGESANQTIASKILAATVQRTPIDMALPGEESPLRTIRRSQWRKASRFASRGVAIALVLIITLGGLLFSQSYLKLHKVFKGSAGTAAALRENVKPELLKGEGSGRVNILLLGRGGGNHEAPDLTDTIMLASVDPVNHTTTLMSIPRDLWVNVPGQGVMKINAAWQSGEFKALGKDTTGSTNTKAIDTGFNSIDSTIKDVLGIDIDYHVLVNFQAFKQAVDTVGGVNINVPSDLVDPTMAWENNGNSVLAKAGAQTFDGNHALIYVRSRETSSDFARAERQRALLVALKGKVISLGVLSNPLKVNGLMNAFGDNIETDLSISNANRLYSIMKGVKDTSITSVGLTDSTNPLVTTGNISGQSVVLPKAGLFQYNDIQQFVRGQLKDPYIMKEKAKILILNGTSTPGLASAQANVLKSYGYNVVGTGNTPTSAWTATTLIDLTHRNKYTKNYLEERLGQTAATSLSDNSIPTNGADFVIIIGSNEASNTQAPAN